MWRTAWTGRVDRYGVPALVVAAALLRLPFLGAPLSSDEGGFLMVGGQWSPGTSLYGDYWVDRPPLLITIYQLADLLGGGIALRLIGIVAVGVSVVLAAGVGRLAAPADRRAPLVAAAAAAIFLTSPLYGAREVDGELLAVPFLLAGMLAVLSATSGHGGPRAWALAGLAAVAAVSIKQNMFDVGVAVAAAVGWMLWNRHWRAAGVAAAAFAAGAAVMLGTVLGWAALHGTTVPGLWDAVVKFRAAAARVIASSATGTNEFRAQGLVAAFLLSGALGILLVAVLPSLRRRNGRHVLLDHPDHPHADLVVLAAAVAAWEAFSVIAGGSYWLHYLIGTVPGLVLVAAVSIRYRPGRLRLTGNVLAYAAVLAVAGTAVVAPVVGDPTPSTQVGDFLERRADPGDTGVVAFGYATLLHDAGLSSPYPHLWSLPVRVRDPELARLTRILRGPDAPTWVVVMGDSTTTWGVDGTTADEAIDERYRQVRVIDDWHVYHLDEGR
ncbi:hypothetical protein [Nocardioides panacisoli]|uniref:Glycosyltransferase RgtA/B/C/D-like domain-containing protein n=1 Tax=Nocardioides panacisoli TaxID=627624 RepID=A0ABP7IUM5_9ACTN